jgi:hypothetical protein
MKLPGQMNAQGLALFGGPQRDGEEGTALTARMFDLDGDGRNDIFLVDFDNDGTVDSAIRAFDADGDGVNDTFVQYDEDGEIQAIGRLNPESRDFEVVSEDSDDFEDVISSLDLAEAPAPDEALFTTFDDPYFIDSFGTIGEEVPEAFEDAAVFADTSVAEIDEEDLSSLETGAIIEDGEDSPTQPEAASEAEEPDSTPLEVTPQVVEIEDYSGAGDGSDLHAKIDQDGDGLADDDQRLSRTSDGTWHGDINRDGYSEEVAFDRDQDGRIDSVDTMGRGSSTEVVGAEQVVSPESEDIVDRHPGEDDYLAEESQATVAADEEDDFSASDADAVSTTDPDSASDSADSYDPGSAGSDYSSDADDGSTTLDSDPTDSGGTDIDSS